MSVGSLRFRHLPGGGKGRRVKILGKARNYYTRWEYPAQGTKVAKKRQEGWVGQKCRGISRSGPFGKLRGIPEQKIPRHRSRLFCNLPEVEKPADFDVREAQRMVARSPFQPRRNMVAARLKQWLDSV